MLTIIDQFHDKCLKPRIALDADGESRQRLREHYKQICSRVIAAAKVVKERQRLGKYVPIQPQRRRHAFTTSGARKLSATSLFKTL